MGIKNQHVGVTLVFATGTVGAIQLFHVVSGWMIARFIEALLSPLAF